MSLSGPVRWLITHKGLLPSLTVWVPSLVPTGLKDRITHLHICTMARIYHLPPSINKCKIKSVILSTVLISGGSVLNCGCDHSSSMRWGSSPNHPIPPGQILHSASSSSLLYFLLKNGKIFSYLPFLKLLPNFLQFVPRRPSRPCCVTPITSHPCLDGHAV